MSFVIILYVAHYKLSSCAFFLYSKRVNSTVFNKITAITFTIKLAEETKSFKNLNSKLYNIPFPGCENEIFRSKSYWKCYIRRFSFNLYHPVGTARMGKDFSDRRAVVDSKLR